MPHNYEFRWAVISNHPVVGKKWSRLIYDEAHATATGKISNHLLCHTQTVWAVTGTPITKNVESSLARLLGLLCGDLALSTKVHKENMAHIMVRHSRAVISLPSALQETVLVSLGAEERAVYQWLFTSLRQQVFHALSA